MATPDRTLLTEANVNDLSPLGRKLNETSGRLNVVEVATGTQYGNVPTLTNVTEIPTDVSGRVDLVYTQPTTVHFANPGLTDIVLSIEGYEHITWEGVVVHGLPDITGVVWASAMWRDRDSTWHLLCEQDASQGGGGGSELRSYAKPMMEHAPRLDVNGSAIIDEADYFKRPFHDVTPMPAPYPTEQSAWKVVSALTDPVSGAEFEVFQPVSLPGDYGRIIWPGIYQKVIYQIGNPLSTTSPTGLAWAPQIVEFGDTTLNLSGLLLITQDPLMGINPSATFDIPPSVNPTPGYWETGNNAPESYFDLPGGNSARILFNHSAENHNGGAKMMLYFGSSGLANPIPPPPEGKANHVIQYSLRIPYAASGKPSPVELL